MTALSIPRGRPQRKVYGWEADGKFHLSRFEKDVKGPKNTYDSRGEAEAEATERQVTVEWQ